MIADCVEQVNADLASDPKLCASQVSRFLILHKELDPDDDELTRTRRCAAPSSRRSTAC